MSMRHINYNHLFYFWNVADLGSIAAASKRLYLTPQTISTQIKHLEEATGTPLFQKQGRRLVLTEQGTVVKGFADEIFSLGRELSLFMRGADTVSTGDLRVGIVETLPKIAVEQFLEPAFDAGTRLLCTEGDLDSLVKELTNHRLDLVLSDQSVSTGDSSKVHTHFLGVSKLAFYASDNLIDQFKTGLPGCLNDAPIIMPYEASPLRRAAEDWLSQQGITTPAIIAECSDSALIKAMAAAGRGLFVAPLNIQDDIEQATGCKVLVSLDGFEERYYAMTLDRKIIHPVVNEITDSARTALSLS